MTSIFDEYAFDTDVPAAVVEHLGCGWRYRFYSESLEDGLTEIRRHHDAEHGAPATAEQLPRTGGQVQIEWHGSSNTDEYLTLLRRNIRFRGNSHGQGEAT